MSDKQNKAAVNIPAEQTTNGAKVLDLPVRFYVNAGARSERAPVGRAEVEIIPGTALTTEIYPERDSRGTVTGFRAALPGTRYGQIFGAKPVFVTDAKGTEYPVRDTKDPIGQTIEQQWQSGIVAGWFDATRGATPDNPLPNPKQSLTLRF